MLSDNFDKKIKESLEHGSSSFEEPSWQKMEIMLDRHLPQKKNDRRRMLFLLVFFFMLGGGTALLLTRGFTEKKQGIIFQEQTGNESKADKLNSFSNRDNTNSNNIISNTPVPDNSVTEKDNSSKQQQILQSKFPDAKNSPVKKTILSGTGRSNKIKTVSLQKNSSVEITNALTENISSINNKTGAIKEKVSEAENNIEEIKTNAEATKTVDPGKAIVQVIKPENSLQVEKNKPAKNQRSLLKNIFFTVSAGPDLSAVGLSKTGKLNISAGAGLGYNISNRFSIRTGFYAAKKVYTAAPKDYNPPANFWNYYPNLKHIDADCKVYEVPLMIDYNLSVSKKQIWFVSAGISSLFMKKEVYNYYYKPATASQYIYYARTYENKNKHYFSILDLSGGFAMKINSFVTLQAEPYLKIALNGVGYGKVNLNSAGVLFSAAIHPFASKGKK